MNPEQSIAYLNTLTLAEPQPAVAAFAMDEPSTPPASETGLGAGLRKTN